MATLTNRHVNSKIVTIYRAGSFLEDAQSTAAEFMSQSRKSIGSYYAATLGIGVGTGLTFEEQDVLMPLLISIPKEDRTFREGVERFFANLSTQIPYGVGAHFEIGLQGDNDVAIGATVTILSEVNGKEVKQEVKNLPINMKDFIRYRHARGHPYVAATKELAAGDQTMQFYIFDPEAAKLQETAIGDQRDKVLTEYLKISADPEKIDAMLTLLGTDPRMFGDKASEKKAALRELAESGPARFLSTMTTKMFDQQVLLQTMINVGTVEKLGGQYIDKETGKVLGFSQDDAAAYLQNEQNAEHVVLLKVRMQEGKKKAVAKKALPKQLKTTARS